MATPAASDAAPDARQALAALQQFLQPPSLKHLPAILELFAHFQLLSLRIKQQARIALQRHVELLEQLEQEGLSPKQLVERGVLNKAEGRELERLTGEKEETSREDVMMELSMEFRIYHLALIATRTTKFEKVAKLFTTYFPELPPPPSSQNDERRAVKWDNMIHSQSKCYIRAMSPDQASRMALYRQRAQAMFERAASLHAKKLLGQTVIPVEALLRDRYAESGGDFAQQVLQLAEHVVDDAETMTAIFGAEEDKEHVQDEVQMDEDVGMGEDGSLVAQEYESTDVIQAASDTQGALRGLAEEAGIPEDQYEDSMGESEEIEHAQARPRRKPRPSLVEDESLPQTYSPPPLRAFPPAAQSSASKPYRPNMPTPPTSASPSERPRSEQRPSPSPSRPKPRVSGLKPISAPDYTRPLEPRHIDKAMMHPFPARIVKKAPPPQAIGKRSIESAGFGPTTLEEERRTKRTREASEAVES